MPTKDPDKLRAKSARWRAKNPNYNRDYWRKLRLNNPEKIKEYYYYNKEKRKEYDRRYKLKNPEKLIARSLLNKAINDGKIVRPDICQWCGSDYFYTGQVIDAHHEDHSKPLDVIWLCKDCHAKCY